MPIPPRMPENDLERAIANGGFYLEESSYELQGSLKAALGYEGGISYMLTFEKGIISASDSSAGLAQRISGSFVPFDLEDSECRKLLRKEAMHRLYEHLKREFGRRLCGVVVRGMSKPSYEAFKVPIKLEKPEGAYNICAGKVTIEMRGHVFYRGETLPENLGAEE